MFRRNLINLFLAFIIFPFIMLLSNYIGRYLLHNYSQFTGNFENYTEVLVKESLLFGLFVLLLLLLPYNLILLFFQSKNKSLSFQAKIGIFLGIEIAESLIGGLWIYSSLTLPGSLEFVFFLCAICIIMVSFHYWLIDRKVEKIKQHQA